MIPKNLREVMLLSQLYGRDRDICQSIGHVVISSEKDVAAVINSIHKRDPLAVLSYVYQDFMSLLTTRRGQNDPFNNYESRFQALISKLHSHGTEVKLSEAVLAFALLANADVDSTQRISVVANSAPRPESFKDTGTTIGRTIRASIEDIRPAVSKDELAAMQDAIDEF